MSLRLRLFMLIGGLVALLVGAQWWWTRALAQDLSTEIDEVASAVGHSVATFFRDVDLHGVAMAPHGRVIECQGDDCDVTILEDADVARRHVSGTAGDGAREAKVMIKKFRREAGEGEGSEAEARDGEEGEAEPDGVYAYTFRHTTGDPGSQERVEKRVEIHIEHRGDARYLWLAGPSMERRFQIPQRGFSEKLERFSQRQVFGSMAFLGLGLVLAGVVAHRVTTPLRLLAGAARRLGEGALGLRVPHQASGEVGQALAAFNHMSGRLEDLDRRNRELSARKHLGEIGEISRGLAHTLRNPLNALGLSVEELAAGVGEGSTAELAESARRQIRRIDSSLKSFLALASQSDVAVGDVDLGELVEDVALEALQDCRGQVRLDVAPAGGLPRLRAIEPELRAVLQALVVNAMEASPQGGRVTIRSAASGCSVGPPPGERKRWRLEIDDEGPGLPAEVRERLFTPHLSTKANGSGMGLFLAHRIATGRYGGGLELIDLEDEDGRVRGTRAVLELGDRTVGEDEPGG